MTKVNGKISLWSLTRQLKKGRGEMPGLHHFIIYFTVPKKEGGIYKRDEVEIDDLQKVSLVDGDDTLSSDPKIFA